METIGISILLLLMFWGFMPLRAIFPYLLFPTLMLGFVGFFLFLGVSSSMTNF